MKKIYLAGTALSVLCLGFFSCKKTSSENVNISTPEFQTGQTITTTSLVGGASYHGTLLKGTTYTFSGPITVNKGDTLLMQSGVKLLATDPSAMILVYGTFISLGTKDNPNWITGNSETAAQKLSAPTDPSVDPALSGTIPKAWGGIQCDTSCHMLNLKWTHLEFVGGVASDVLASGFEGIYKKGDLLFATSFQNPKGYYIMEDCWIYGTSADVARIKGGNVAIFRNTVEKSGFNDGDAFNVKGGTQGDMAYNMIIGTAKGGTKASNKGQPVGAQQTRIYMFNNTYVNGGWRSSDPDRGADVNFEEGCDGYAYNNIMVNCRTGVRVLSAPPANFANMKVGNNLTYGDTVGVIDNIYPAGKFLFAENTDIPSPSTFYPGYSTITGTTSILGISYDGSSQVGKNNPQFVNYALPISPINGSYKVAFSQSGSIGTNDFHLKSTSPAVGVGFTGFSPLNSTSVITNTYLKATVTGPNKDLGAYPTDGTGNEHTLTNSQ